MLGNVFKVASKLRPHISLKNLFVSSAGSAVGAVSIAPESAGRFVGNRVASFFNGAAKGVMQGVSSSPALMIASAIAIAAVGMHIWNKLTK